MNNLLEKCVKILVSNVFRFFFGHILQRRHEGRINYRQIDTEGLDALAPASIAAKPAANVGRRRHAPNAMDVVEPVVHVEEEAAEDDQEEVNVVSAARPK